MFMGALIIGGLAELPPEFQPAKGFPDPKTTFPPPEHLLLRRRRRRLVPGWPFFDQLLELEKLE